MDAIKALTERVSMPRLCMPPPTDVQLETLFDAANRAADHGNLKPWRFKVVQGEGLDALGSLFLDAALIEEPDMSQAQQLRIKGLSHRAPMVVIAIAHCQAHPKVPEVEQIIATGAAVQNIINAAFAMDIGAFWRTGALAYNKATKLGLNLSENEHIVGFVYLGSNDGEPRSLRENNSKAVYESWPDSCV